MTFQEFQATGREVPNLKAHLAEAGLFANFTKGPARIYAGGLYLERDQRFRTEAWRLVGPGLTVTDNDLAAQEARLFCYFQELEARAEVYRLAQAAHLEAQGVATFGPRPDPDLDRFLEGRISSDRSEP